MSCKLVTHCTHAKKHGFDDFHRRGLMDGFESTIMKDLMVSVRAQGHSLFSI